MKQQRHFFPCLVTIAILGVIIYMLLWTPSSVHADLPPRDTVTPIPTPTDVVTPAPSPSTREPKTPVATILLSVEPADKGLSSVVQWQDAQGDWHDVESWRGDIVNGRTIWWVTEKDWGTGPFRWAVFAQTDGILLATSEPFYLPSQAGTIGRVSIQLHKRLE